MLSLPISQTFSAVKCIGRCVASVRLFSLRPPTPHANTEATRIKLAYLLNASVGIVKRTQRPVCQQWVGFLCFLRHCLGFPLEPLLSILCIIRSFIFFK